MTFVLAIEELVLEHKECVATIEAATKRKLEIELSLSTVLEKLGHVNLNNGPEKKQRKQRSDIGVSRKPYAAGPVVDDNFSSAA